MCHAARRRPPECFAMRFLPLILAALAAAAPAMAAAQTTSIPHEAGKPWLHAATGLSFPAEAGGLKRTDVRWFRSGGGCRGHLRQRGRERNHHALPVPQHIRRRPRVVRSRPRRDPGPPGVVRRGHAGRHPRLHAARPGSCLRADGELPHGRPVSGDDAGRAARPGLLRQGAPPRPARIPRRWRRWSARSWTA